MSMKRQLLKKHVELFVYPESEEALEGLLTESRKNHVVQRIATKLARAQKYNRNEQGVGITLTEIEALTLGHVIRTQIQPNAKNHERVRKLKQLQYSLVIGILPAADLFEEEEINRVIALWPHIKAAYKSQTILDKYSSEEILDELRRRGIDMHEGNPATKY